MYRVMVLFEVHYREIKWRARATVDVGCRIYFSTIGETSKTYITILKETPKRSTSSQNQHINYNQVNITFTLYDSISIRIFFNTFLNLYRFVSRFKSSGSILKYVGHLYKQPFTNRDIFQINVCFEHPNTYYPVVVSSFVS